MGGSGGHLGYSGVFGSLGAAQKGVITYGLSPFRQRAFKGLITEVKEQSRPRFLSDGTINTARLCACADYYVF
jgi:hypothetical protein